MRDPHVKVDVRVREGALGFARERLIKNMQSGIVMAIGVERESEVTVGLGIGGIHTEGGAGLGQCAVGIVCPVKKVRKLTVSFGETGHQARRFREFIERIVEPLLPAKNGSKYKMQQSMIRCSRVGIVAKQNAYLVFSGVEIFVVNESGDLSCRARAGTGLGN